MQSHTFLSTLSLRRATARCQQHRHSQRISIHALLAESDGTGAGNCWPVPHFYPRSPCGERLVFLRLAIERDDFYPRSPCGERLMNSDILSGSCYFYPRSPCGERPAIGLILGTAEIFLSTLSLRRATRNCLHGKPRTLRLFLSTLSLRRATAR